MPFGGTLSAPRRALVAVNDALRMELYPWGIRVALIEGGSIPTRAVNKLEAAAEATLDRLPPPAAPATPTPMEPPSPARSYARRRVARRKSSPGLY